VQDDDLKNDFLGLLCDKWGKSSAEQWSVNSDQFGRLRFVVSHSSTIKLWMNGAQRFLVFHDGPPATLILVWKSHWGRGHPPYLS
jgi:hypothetical protein